MKKFINCIILSPIGPSVSSYRQKEAWAAMGPVLGQVIRTITTDPAAGHPVEGMEVLSLTE